MQNHHLLQKIIALGKNYHLPDNWLVGRPYLFTDFVAHLTPLQKNQITNAIDAIEAVIALPSFKAMVFGGAEIDPADKPQGNTALNSGVLFSYDFHLTAEGPKLIEINTNAGGAFFVALLEEAQGKERVLQTWEKKFLNMFTAEWQSAHPQRSLKSIAIVDDDPHKQYFYPEFLLFQSLFKAHGIQCCIADPADLFRREGKLRVADTSIDLAYNRLTDFDLIEPAHDVLKQAYTNSEAIVTPHPYVYALYAHKRNLVFLSDADLLKNLGATKEIIAELQQVIPHTYLVDSRHAETLWDMRKRLFFKPLSSHGGKGVYRGKNITTRVFKEVLAGGYIAQELVPPGEVQIEGESRKIDFRAYVYRGEILGLAARLYQGQATNFRDPGSGFAVVE